jgi:hypothetical protein
MFFNDLPTEIISIIILYLNIHQLGYILSSTNKKCCKIIYHHSIWNNIIIDFNFSHVIYNIISNNDPKLISLDDFVNELSWIGNLSLTKTDYKSAISFAPNRFSDFKNKCYQNLINVWTTNLHQLQRHYNIIKNSLLDMFLLLKNYYETLTRDLEYCRNNSDELYIKHVKNIKPIKLSSFKQSLYNYIEKINKIHLLINNIKHNNNIFHIKQYDISYIEYYIPFRIVNTEKYKYIHFLEIEITIVLLEEQIVGLYRGPIINQKPHGYGSFISINNEFYKGLFQNGCYSGDGILVDTELQYIWADWSNNNVATIIDYFVIT